MSLLQDQRCDAALTQLDDAICSYERATGREYTLILIPHSPDEEEIIAVNGKPMFSYGPTPREALEFALKARAN